VSYEYATERKELLSESGIETLIKVRDKVKYLLSTAGAFRLQEAGVCSWQEIAAIDYMVEKKELIEFPRECWGQYRVFTSPQVHNR
jgi:hypothetical protein